MDPETEVTIKFILGLLAVLAAIIIGGLYAG